MKETSFKEYRMKELNTLYKKTTLAIDADTNLTEETKKVLESALFLLHHYYSNFPQESNSYAHLLITIALAKVIDPTVSYFKSMSRELMECLAEFRDFEDNIIAQFESLPQSVKFIMTG
jgi:hypothetical protein